MVFNPKVIQVSLAYASKVFAGGNTQTLTGVQSPPGSTSQPVAALSVRRIFTIPDLFRT
jgi:hypothetical protein